MRNLLRFPSSSLRTRHTVAAFLSCRSSTYQQFVGAAFVDCRRGVRVGAKHRRERPASPAFRYPRAPRRSSESKQRQEAIASGNDFWRICASKSSAKAITSPASTAPCSNRMANVLGSLLPSIASKRSSSFPALDRNSLIRDRE